MNRKHRGRVLIWEPAVSGHVLVYCRLLAHGATSRGLECHILLSQEVLAAPERAHLGELSEDVVLHYAKDEHSPGSVARFAERLGCGVVIVPHADPQLVGLSLPSRSTVRWTLLVMRDPRWESETGMIRVWRRLAKLTVARALQARRGRHRVLWLDSPIGTSSPKRVVAPDPVILDEGVESITQRGSALRRTLGMSDGVYWFGLSGGISGRKNVALVAEALVESLNWTDRRVGLALIGPVYGEARTDVERANEILTSVGLPLIVADRTLSNLEVNAAIAAMDCAVMAYSSDSPNSTTWKAAAVGTRVVAAGSEVFRSFAEATGVALTCPLERGPLARAMAASTVLPAPQPRPELGTEDFVSSVLEAWSS